ncbi:unnamed protein product [Lactuca saligna]|uniref:Uncharacterized protein n=1 Tax=Lactuca saligna TaxID=75948 RepID=A0AA35YC67_LACSI|nr:unnamed protein product [Lactuca saligna]
MQDCKKLKSVEHPPRTLSRLLLFSRHESFIDKVVFDLEMSPIKLSSNWWIDYHSWSYEVEGMIKVQQMVDVEEKLLCSLGWINLDFLDAVRVGTNPCKSKIQTMFYEFGIFSTIYEAEEMPSWFRHRSVGPLIGGKYDENGTKRCKKKFKELHEEKSRLKTKE